MEGRPNLHKALLFKEERAGEVHTPMADRHMGACSCLPQRSDLQMSTPHSVSSGVSHDPLLSVRVVGVAMTQLAQVCHCALIMEAGNRYMGHILCSVLAWGHFL